jgi:protocatechuate 3,4-dioxygenase beta subunit
MEFIQTGNNGLYFIDDTLFNPIHYGFVKTDANGEFTLRGSLPGYYPVSQNRPTPRHTHFNIATPNYRPYNGEFNYSDDSILQSLLAEGANISDPIAVLYNDSRNIYTVTIPLQHLNQ